MSAILVIGNAVLDIINVVEHYPEEDEELHTTQQVIRAGGNAFNTAQKLANQGHQCTWLGTLANDLNAQQIIQQAASINISHAVIKHGSTPTSYITLNAINGSRTIVHHRALPELSIEAIQAIEINHYDWFHFEGRNIEVLAQALPKLRAQLFDQVISLEVEKPRGNIESLIPYADVVMFSRPFARSKGFDDAETFLKAMQATYPNKWLSCTWGSKGAWLMTSQGELLHQTPSPDLIVTNSTGAGDAFNAGLIHGFRNQQHPQQRLKTAIQWAEQQLTQAL